MHRKNILCRTRILCMCMIWSQVTHSYPCWRYLWHACTGIFIGMKYKLWGLQPLFDTFFQFTHMCWMHVKVICACALKQTVSIFALITLYQQKVGKWVHVKFSCFSSVHTFIMILIYVKSTETKIWRFTKYQHDQHKRPR